MFCDIQTPDGQPAAADPRNVLRRALSKASDMGFTFYIHPEIEFYLLKSSQLNEDGEPVPVDKAGYFDNVPGGTAHDFRRRAVQMLEQLGISVEFSHHEGGPGQNEIDLRYADALTMADNIMSFRTVIKEVAIEQGVYATFMPKPFTQHPGSGMHTHQSLWSNGKPLFYDEKGYAGLSDIARWYIGGILKHAGAILAFTNPTMNSYRRLVKGFEAPVNLVYSAGNRSAAIRIPITGTNPKAKRIEFRAPDASSNPYLAFAVQMMAGLDGILNKIEPHEPVDKDLYELPADEAKLIPQVPGSLEEALIALENDHEFLLQGNVFTKDLIDEWVSMKRAMDATIARFGKLDIIFNCAGGSLQEDVPV